MRNIIRLIISGIAMCMLPAGANAQLYINGGGLTIDSGAIINVKGDLIGSRDIPGPGKIVLNGSISQYLNMNGYSVSNLEINNTQNVTLTSAAKVLSTLIFVNGRIIAGNNNFTMSSAATASGMGAGKFVETNGSGQVFKELMANAASFEMPIGVTTVYRPVYISTVASAYSSAKIGVRALAVSNSNRPSFSTDYLNAYWPITRTGITGTVTAVGQYADPSDVFGTKAKLRGCFYDGLQWSSQGSTYDAAQNRVGATVAAGGGALYGMTQFATLGVKAFMEGSYTSNAMSNYLYDMGLDSDSTASDSIAINLWSPSALSSAGPGYSNKSIIHADGSAGIILPEATIGNSYYIALKHRNSIETWSASPVAFSANVYYDFTDAASKAYGSNQADMGGGRFAMFSGDINQDGAIESEDYARMENDVLSILFGYQLADLTGDGVVESADYVVMENNVIRIIFAARP